MPYALHLPKDEALKPRTLDFLSVIASCSLPLCICKLVSLSKFVIVEQAVRGLC
jgi:hypothetical protein